MEKTIKQTKKTFRELRETTKNEIASIYKTCKNNAQFVKVFDAILDNNIKTLDEIVSKQKATKKYTDPEMLEELQHNFGKSSAERRRRADLAMEKDTLVLITDERNKNIEMYYIIYSLFILLLVIIQGSVLLFK